MRLYHQYIIHFISCVEEIEKLKVQLSDKDRHIAKLMKERGPVKEISSVGIQFDYIVPSMGKYLL